MNNPDVPPYTITNVWLKAAIAGGLWASVEIIIGSFLHNLKIPFAGSSLAAFGIILLVAFAQIWPEKGLIIRAGLVCALMKSISPSAVILGPMTGILAEAILLETGIYLFGRNLAGYLIGGALALLSALMHKIVSLLILFGTNIIKIYLSIFHFASGQINMPDAEPITLIVYVVTIYLALGATAALLGFYIGRKAKKGNSLEQNYSTQIDQGKNFFRTSPLQKFKTVLLFFHIVSIPGGLVLINYSSPLFYLPVFASYLTFCLIYYKGITGRLKKTFFWLQLLLIVVLAFLFWNYLSDHPAQDSYEGLWIGLAMALRAVFVIIAFSSLSIELRNPKIKNLIFLAGFRQLYLALNLSFAALPAMVTNLSSSKKAIKNPFLFFPLLLKQAEDWHKSLKEAGTS
jgi:hypothetical protein